MFSPTRARVMGKTGKLYRPETTLKHGEYTESRLCWVVAWADDCKILPREGLAEKGKLVTIPDSFCFIHNDVDLWDEYKDDPAFIGLTNYAEQYKCDIETKMVHEGSICAELEDLWKNKA